MDGGSLWIEEICGLRYLWIKGVWINEDCGHREWIKGSMDKGSLWTEEVCG